MIRLMLISLCLFLVFHAAGGLQEGATSRMWDEAGTVLADDRPWWRLRVIACLILFADFLWVVVRIGERGEGWYLDEVVAEAALFLGVVETLLAVVTICGFIHAGQAIAPAYYWFLGIDVAIAAAAGWLAYRLRCVGQHKKPVHQEIGFDD